MTTPAEAFVGIDVGKTWLDVALWGSQAACRLLNDEQGIAAVVARVAAWEAQLIAVEASGGYEQHLVQALLLAKLPLAVVNPTTVRALSKATGKLAKTDVIDARLIAEYACKIQPAILAPKEAKEIRLKALISRREQPLEMRTAEQNRLGTVHHSLQGELREHIQWLNGRIQQLEAEMEALLDHLPELRAQAERLDSIPGVGLITAVTVLAKMPELGQVVRQKSAALAGLAPFNRDSGQKRGMRRIFGGRKGVRRVLYMACLSAIKCNPVIRGLYLRLTEKGRCLRQPLQPACARCSPS